MSWFDSSKARPAFMGEVSLLKFLFTFLRYSNRVEGAQIMADLKASYKIGDWNSGNSVNGLNKLLSDYADNTITLFYTVKVDGEKMYQEVNSKNDTFFLSNPDGTIPSSALYNLKKVVEDCDKRGATLCPAGREYVLDDILVKFSPETVKINVC